MALTQKTTRWLISLILIATAVTVIMVFYFRAKRKKEAAAQAQNDFMMKQGSQSSGVAGVLSSFVVKDTKSPAEIYRALPKGKFPLKKGSKNKEVFVLQKAMNSLNGTKLTVDGSFGSGTEAALKEHYNRITIDGPAYNRITSAFLIKASLGKNYSNTQDAFDKALGF